MMSSIEKIEKQYTLTLVFDKERILLGYKKRGFGEGKWNGFGGKVEPGETILSAAFRELEEECGLKANSLYKHGILTFEFLDDPIIYIVHLFSTSTYVGDVTESEEMRPKWFNKDEIPFDNMWLDDRYWLPQVIAGEQFNGYFLYENQDKILDYKLESVA